MTGAMTALRAMPERGFQSYDFEAGREELKRRRRAPAGSEGPIVTPSASCFGAGCPAHVRAAAARRGLDLRVAHVLELVAERLA